MVGEKFAFAIEATESLSLMKEPLYLSDAHATVCMSTNDDLHNPEIYPLTRAAFEIVPLLKYQQRQLLTQTVETIERVEVC